MTFPAQKFGDLRETYKGTRFLTFEWGANGLHVPTGTATATPTSYKANGHGYIHAHTNADAYSDPDGLAANQRPA